MSGWQNVRLADWHVRFAAGNPKRVGGGDRQRGGGTVSGSSGRMGNAGVLGRQWCVLHVRLRALANPWHGIAVCLCAYVRCKLCIRVCVYVCFCVCAWVSLCVRVCTSCLQLL